MVEIHYFAAARAARGVPQESVDGPAAAGTLADLLDDLGSRYTTATAGGMTLARIFDRCSFLVDGHTVTREDAATVDLSGDGTAGTSGTQAVQRVDVLPPFAGG